jgi:hypothetical protein
MDKLDIFYIVEILRIAVLEISTRVQHVLGEGVAHKGNAMRLQVGYLSLA